MIKPRPSGRVRTSAACATSLALVLVPWAARASASDLYFERSLMSAADSRCGLFTPEIGAALNAAKAQARGAALRAGVAGEALRQSAARALARAGAVACRSPDLTTAAARVRNAFEGYSRLVRMTYPGDLSDWRADRNQPRDGVAWRLSQTASLSGGGVMTFGLAGQRGRPTRLVAVMDLGAGPAPYAARLVLRDQARAPEPYLGVLQVSSTARLPLQSRVTPRFAARVYAAETRGQADPWLLPAGVKSATAFSFPIAAADALAGLDPREAVTIELVYAGRAGDTVRQAYVEVGDFAAGQAFLTPSAR